MSAANPLTRPEIGRKILLGWGSHYAIAIYNSDDSVLIQEYTGSGRYIGQNLYAFPRWEQIEWVYIDE